MRRLFAWLSLWLTGCASPLAQARESFDQARYPDALAEYRELGPQMRELTRPQFFEYALYRGLSHLALGDAAPAERWLLVAKRLAEDSPSLANAEQRGRLLSAWRAMGRMPGE